MTTRARILYLGLPLGALALLRGGLDVAAACISRTASPGMRRLRRALLDRGGLVLGKPDLDDAGVHELIASAKPDMIASWFWTRRIPPSVLKLSPDRFGVHPSLLPRHRGPDPYFWAIARGDRETGVTAHVLSEEYDTGGVLVQRRLPIPEDVNAHGLARMLDRPGLELLVETATRLSKMEVIDPVAQDETQGTEAPFPSNDDCEIQWDQPVRDVLCRIRAAAPEPGAFTGYGDDTIVIARARVFDGDASVLEPGDVALAAAGVVVRAADGAVLVESAVREGDAAPRRGTDVAALFPGIARLGG
jgi:methionyl-tRNA formyltransferase